MFVRGGVFVRGGRGVPRLISHTCYGDSCLTFECVRGPGMSCHHSVLRDCFRPISSDRIICITSSRSVSGTVRRRFSGVGNGQLNVLLDNKVSSTVLTTCLRKTSTCAFHFLNKTCKRSRLTETRCCTQRCGLGLHCISVR